MHLGATANLVALFFGQALLDKPVMAREILPSFRRKPESRIVKSHWTPAFAGVTRGVDRIPPNSSECLNYGTGFMNWDPYQIPGRITGLTLA